MNLPFPTDKLQRFHKLSAEYLSRVARDLQSQRGWYDDDGVRQGGLIAFVRYFWHVLEPARPFVDGWPIQAMCEHLEAVTFGEIKRLLINVPPGFMKSLLVDCFWPAWEWGPMGKVHYRYIAFSYSAALTERDNDKFRTLVSSSAYQKLYGPLRTAMRKEEMPFEESDESGQVTLRNKTTIKVINTGTGWKLASSVGGVATGERGDRVIIDDPHSVQDAESERIRNETIRWFRESISSRFNDLDTGALIIIMQRVHYDDVSGIALGKGFNYTHLCIPWEFDPSRAFDNQNNLIRNQIGWCDPRAIEDDPDGNAGEPAWRARFSDEAIAELRAEMGGAYPWAAQMQQSPIPRGEGIFKREWWQLWEHPNNRFPEFEYIVASLDGAFTEDEENDPSAMTVWGVFTTGDGKRAIMLIRAWRKHLQFSAKRVERRPNESHAVWRQRTQSSWGLMEWVHDTCTWLNGRPMQVDKLLIEAKASGISAAQELQNRYSTAGFAIQLCPVKGDKVARAYAVQPTFSNGLVYAPEFDWSEMVIEEMEMFPRGKYDDLTDSATQALRYLRDAGLAQTEEELVIEERDRGMHRPRRQALYPV